MLTVEVKSMNRNHTSLSIVLFAVAGLAIDTGTSAYFANAAGKHQSMKENITGTYAQKVTGNSEDSLEVKQLRDNRLWFHLIALRPFRDPTGSWDANTGEAEGTIPIKGHSAMWNYESGGPPQKNCLEFDFAPGRITIKQTGDCGFGMGVDASGVYKKVSGKVGGG